jgi:outer membrane protein
MPSVDLFAQRNQSSFDTDTDEQRRHGPADSDETDDTIGVQVTIPIFSGGVTQSRVREQVYLQRASREKLEGTMRAAERETRDAYLGVIAEKARVQALQQSVKSNQTALEATEAGSSRHAHDGRRARCATPPVRGTARLCRAAAMTT